MNGAGHEENTAALTETKTSPVCCNYCGRKLIFDFNCVQKKKKKLIFDTKFTMSQHHPFTKCLNQKANVTKKKTENIGEKNKNKTPLPQFLQTIKHKKSKESINR